MHHALEMIDRWRHYVLGRQFCDPRGWELQNMLTVARLIVQTALQREESRGVHLRTDFLEMDNQHWQRHITVQLEEPLPQ
jgi:L-aspartate oxidase